MLTVYALKTCDTCKKAIKWLDSEGIAHAVHDVRADGLPSDIVSMIVAAVGVDKAVNKRSTTWKGLDEAAKANLDADRAVALITANPTLMKRPAFVADGKAVVGFDATAQHFAKTNGQ
ncbi:MAG: Spx/MgsR family RNA polymerase-binding regulatory protein [Pseudomonadota bacterium]